MSSTQYDRTMSFMLALSALLGIAVIIMLGLWLSATVFQSRQAVPVKMQPFGGGGTSELDAIDPFVMGPGTESDVQEQTLLQSFESITDLIQSKSALFSDASPIDDNLSESGRKGDGRSKGSSFGPSGPPRRWEIIFPDGNTLDEYAAQLDFFQIELGILLPNGEIEYVSQLAARTPWKRKGRTKDEDRFYLTLKKGDLEAAERELMKKADVDAANKLVIKFLAPEWENRLAALEKESAKERFEHIRGTCFAVRRQNNGSGFEFYVLEQQFAL